MPATVRVSFDTGLRPAQDDNADTDVFARMRKRRARRERMSAVNAGRDLRNADCARVGLGYHVACIGDYGHVGDVGTA